MQRLTEFFFSAAIPSMVGLQTSETYGPSIPLTIRGKRWGFTKLAQKKEKPKRMYHGMAYDSESDRILVWGGRLLERLGDNSIWDYDFNTDTWTQYKSPSAPQPEYTYPGMVYSSVSDRMVIFGGAEVITPFDCEVTRQTWTYDFNTNTWSRLAPAATPPPMGIHAMAYCPRTDLIVVFGGEVDRLYSNHVVGHTWIFDPETNKWEKK